jgi:hypothetical protein
MQVKASHGIAWWMTEMPKAFPHEGVKNRNISRESNHKRMFRRKNDREEAQKRVEWPKPRGWLQCLAEHFGEVQSNGSIHVLLFGLARLSNRAPGFC